MKRTYAPSTATALVAVLALSVSGAVWAEGMDKGMSEMSEGHALTQEERDAFSQLDSNKDGKISQEEAKTNANLAKQFGRADSNQDKAIDEGEFARFEMDTEQDK